MDLKDTSTFSTLLYTKPACTPSPHPLLLLYPHPLFWAGGARLPVDPRA